MANIAQMINVLQAMIMTDKEKMVLTPTYYVFKMYVPFQDATFVPVTFDAGKYTNGNITLPRVDALAAKGEKLPPLGGVPVGIKDVMVTKGVRSTAAPHGARRSPQAAGAGVRRRTAAACRPASQPSP